MREQQTDEAPAMTTVEGVTWLTAVISVAVYVIAFFVSREASDYDTTPAGWMALSGMIAGVTLVPAIILTGIRHLVPALRG